MARHHPTLNKLYLFSITVCVGLIFQSKIYQVDSSQCGNVDLLQPTILKGTETLRGQWPFIAALFEAKEDQFFCGGTLISVKHVMTGKVECELLRSVL